MSIPFVFFFLLSLVIPWQPVTGQTIENDKFVYTILDDGSAEITGYNGTISDLIIPSELNGITVTSIGKDAFYNDKGLLSIKLPDSITSIGNNAFKICSNLTRIKVSPDNETFAVIDDVLFNKQTKTLLLYPPGKKNNEYVIPQGIISVGDTAFGVSNNLVSITLPESLVSIGKNPFHMCSNLQRFIIASSNDTFSVIDDVLFDKQTKTLLKYPMGKKDSVYKIPNETVSIADYAFYACRNIESITIPNSVLYIGDRSFLNCENLHDIIFPDNLISIGNYAFLQCYKLETLVLPDSVLSIGDFAFISCKNLSVIRFSSNLSSIGINAFSNCKKLESLILPESISSIGKNAFGGCDNLVSVTIPDSIFDLLIIDELFSSLENITWTVNKNSKMYNWVIENGYDYTYPDSNDWLG